MLSIILMQPEHPGNIGAVARAMANFDLENLVLVDPLVDHLSEEAKRRAKHAGKVLSDAKVITRKELWKSFDTIIGTTARTGTDYNIPRSHLTLKEFSSRCKKAFDSSHKLGLLLGREGKGLSNPEVRKCDFVVKIDASSTYPTLNLSHAAVILFHEIFHSSVEASKIEYASLKEKEVLLKQVDQTLRKMEFATKDKLETQKKVWKRVVGKAMLTKREAFALIGYFKKLL